MDDQSYKKKKIGIRYCRKSITASHTEGWKEIGTGKIPPQRQKNFITKKKKVKSNKKEEAYDEVTRDQKN